MAGDGIFDFPRRLSAEMLDQLACGDPRAIRSRADLRRINRVMGSPRLVARALSPELQRLTATRGSHAVRLLELGAGDGTLMLEVAKRWHEKWPAIHLTLLDRQNATSAATLDEFHRLGWTTQVLCIDIDEWMNTPSDSRWDAIMANLFIHHFDQQTIAALFQVLARRTNWFMACEPRRNQLALLASRLVIFLGANSITRQDAVLSVRGGFSALELSELWTDAYDLWRRKENPAGLFSHIFVAMRKGA